MNKWKAVDSYFAGKLFPTDSVLGEVLAASRAGALPDIGVAPNQGALLHILARSVAARRILEIGTLGGYSSIWLARALPSDGKLITLEVDREHADVARANFKRAGLDGLIDLRLGKAIDLLPQIAADSLGPFDLVFIDADKSNNAAYFDWALKLSRPGSLIIVDNVVRDGDVIDAKSRDSSITGVRRLVDRLAGEKRVMATAMQTVGEKGYDGLLIAMVLN